MRSTVCIAATVALFASSTQALSKSVAPAGKPAAFQLNETTWTYVNKGKRERESIDAEGNYIVQSIAGKHIDHGAGVMKDSKACFTSAMTKEGEVCWTTKPVKIGQSFVARSDKGQMLKVTRVKYVPMTMPK